MIILKCLGIIALSVIIWIFLVFIIACGVEIGLKTYFEKERKENDGN